MKRNRIIAVAIIILLAIAGTSCKKVATPRPRGYFRIDLPEHEYKTYEGECPFMFDIPTYAFIVKNEDDNCWFNVYFPNQKATIYLTYRTIDNNPNINDLDTLLNDAHDFVYKHTIKADAIEEILFANDSAHVYGTLYDIKGNVASQIQFYVTDSVKHFMRGSLYFDCRPNKDSLAPVVDFIHTDIEHLMESFEWK